MNIIIFFSFVLISINSLAGAFTENTANANTSGISATSKTVVPIPIQNIIIGSSIGYVGKQFYESGGMASFGLLPETIKKMSPLAYDKKKLPEFSNPKLIQCKKILDSVNFSLNNNTQFTTNGCESIGMSLKNLNKSKVTAIRYLE